MRLIDLLSKNNNRSKTAILSNNIKLTYLEFEEKISSIIEELIKLGVGRQNKVAILSENSSDYVALIFALWRIGAVPVPMNVKLLQKEIEKQIEIANCRFLLLGDSIDDNIKIDDVIISGIPASSKKSKVKFEEDIEFSIENTAVIIFTSGSTGVPKGVELSFNNLIQSAMTGDKIFKHRENDRWLASLPFYHVGGFSIITRCFIYGAALIIPDSLEIESLKNSIENFQPTLTSFVTTQLKRLIEAGCKPNKELRHILLGGGFMDPSLVEAAINKGWNVSKSYGTSETASFVTALTADEFKQKPHSAGKAIPPNEILIVDEKRNSLHPMHMGEIAVKAQSVSKGYIGNRNESAKKFGKDIFYSGDNGYLDAEGYLFVEARRNDLIVSGGENINPFEVEKEILTHQKIEEACVFGIEDKEWGQAVAAAIVTKDKSKITLAELKDYLREKLPGYKQPKKIFLLEHLPKTEMGKVQKEKVREIINSSYVM